MLSSYSLEVRSPRPRARARLQFLSSEEALGKTGLSCFSEHPEAACLPRLTALPPPSECVTPASASIVTSPSLTLTLLFLSYKDSCEYIELTRIIQAHLSI